MKETFRVRESEIGDIAKNILEALSAKEKEGAKLLHLEGDLGTGKTTFTKELAAHLGIDKDDVQSPTFILKREYLSAHPRIRRLIHIDAYRFLDEEEGKALRLKDDLLDPRNLVVIEWPEKMKSGIPDMTLRFSVVDDDTRDISVDL